MLVQTMDGLPVHCVQRRLQMKDFWREIFIVYQEKLSEHTAERWLLSTVYI